MLKATSQRKNYNYFGLSKGSSGGSLKIVLQTVSCVRCVQKLKVGRSRVVKPVVQSSIHFNCRWMKTTTTITHRYELWVFFSKRSLKVRQEQIV